MLASPKRLGAHVAHPEKFVTDLKDQKYGRYKMHRGIFGKGAHLIRTTIWNPRGTLGRAFKPVLKGVLFTILFKNFFETCYRARLEPPWERFYKEQAKGKPE